ncbi:MULTISPECIES: methyltransferase domain-containing protein [unclassified Mesorhizobium]|uniref:methyltransferase domain-containing protein n=1 Tax=unclassified Mesorhizobium TaxID=325217 RepID=UPI000F762F8B|nr:MULTISPECIES: class I SAM-dependent methyltransferase [unclassified Mesorhizobium]AZO63873.1 SAM-dependent methyltransferase [Mesorhizobium sp. M6A.T.Cr.TU.016.01.1.1]RWP54890.1 MAG: methyltransferase domain-containing protein [Mesorhizobium sp.]RWQ85691.1 MAG: methyltransferase domain-containing protein [Mesorhizobium sp.]
MKNKLDFQSRARIEVDDPPDRVLRHPINSINGWIAIAANETIVIRLSGADSKIPAGALRVSFYPRPDLDQNAAVGFTVYLDLCGVQLVSRSLSIAFVSSNVQVAELTLEVTDEAVALAVSCHAAKATKKARLASLLKDGVRRDSRCFAPSALPDSWAVSPVLEEKRDAVSSHFYGPTIYKFLNEFPQDSIFLDAGAGLRKRPLPSVINAEIYDYPSTDILTIGQSLPFKDNSFDGILSLAVLEHVDDPFLCAKELVRVLKPNGRVFVMIPFLQAEHGYPSHYFNATRSGVVKLFEDLTLKEQVLEKSNHPILSLQQIAGIYLSGLAEECRYDFLEMPVKDLFALAEKHMKDEPHEMLRLDPEKAFHIAWGTTSVFQKE